MKNSGMNSSHLRDGGLPATPAARSWDPCFDKQASERVVVEGRSQTESISVSLRLMGGINQERASRHARALGYLCGMAYTAARAAPYPVPQVAGPKQHACARCSE
ncbi:hypothetical protein DPEC_G00291930 [Dallia pectoralis]|uniref:Uncharacterized protein n=1 Tax=Dallia pectoralis TaxID=75939 RepID=A0ACC2FHT4_DALPE|nr:hypothetical protein DPEC_G00291930 [Dallia pectoralis]